MKKVLITQDIDDLLEQRRTFLNRTDIKVFVAATNDKALKIHLKERVNLIITQLDMPGMPTGQFCSLIREDANLRAVSMIMVCENAPEAIEQSKQCKANCVLTRPVHPIVLMEEAQKLLDIAARETLRVLLSARVESQIGDESFLCRSRNVSATGMLIETEKLLARGTRLSCLFYLPDTRKIQASGAIVRTIEQTPGDDEYQYGFMFTDMTPEDKRALSDFIGHSSIKSRLAGP